jgi:hypothetical protein
MQGSQAQTHFSPVSNLAAAFWSHQNAKPQPRLTRPTEVVFRSLEPETLADYCPTKKLGSRPMALTLFEMSRGR